MSELRVTSPSKAAGGIPAIVSTMRKSIAESGLFGAMRNLLRANQKQQFDCPGCAWPDPDGQRSIAEFCENGAKAIADEATRKQVTADFFREHSVSELRTKSSMWLNAQGRLTEPMLLAAGSDHYQPVSWESAFAKIADQLQALARPDDAIFYTSGRTSNEAAFLYQLFVRLLGTNNLPDCSNLCHESSGKALGSTIGIGKGTVTLEGLENCDLILVVGQNPGSNHPRMLTSLQNAKRNGAKIIAVNPLREVGSERFIHPQELTHLLGRGTQLSDIHVPLRINSDVAFFQFINKALTDMHAQGAEDIIDEDFILRHTNGYDAFATHLESASYEDLARLTGVDEAALMEVAYAVMKAKNIVICWAMGLTQHKNAVANIQEAVNLLLLRGSIGRDNAGVCPVRGHSNVQGDRTMGIWEAPTEEFMRRLEQGLGLSVGRLPRQHGFTAVDAAAAIERDECRFFMSMGGNFIEAMSDTDRLKKIFSNIDLTVQISTKLNPSHLWTGKEALILPVLGRTDADVQNGKAQFVTVENSMGIVHSSQGRRSPIANSLRSEVAVVCALGKRLFAEFPWEEWQNDYDLIRDVISRSIAGFDDFNRKVRAPSGFYLPNAVKDKNEFATASQKAEFTIHTPPQWQLAADELLMMTIRTHDQFNTTVYSQNDRYRGIYAGRKVVLMHPDDMKARKLQRGDLVDLSSHYHGQERRVAKFHAIDYDIPQGCCATYFPETNPLVPLEEFAVGSKTPVSKSIVVRVHSLGGVHIR